jgi:hypothetical protein
MSDNFCPELSNAVEHTKLGDEMVYECHSDHRRVRFCLRILETIHMYVRDGDGAGLQQDVEQGTSVDLKGKSKAITCYFHAV